MDNREPPGWNPSRRVSSALPGARSALAKAHSLRASTFIMWSKPIARASSNKSVTLHVLPIARSADARLGRAARTLAGESRGKVASGALTWNTKRAFLSEAVRYFIVRATAIFPVMRVPMELEPALHRAVKPAWWCPLRGDQTHLHFAWRDSRLRKRPRAYRRHINALVEPASRCHPPARGLLARNARHGWPLLSQSRDIAHSRGDCGDTDVMVLRVWRENAHRNKKGRDPGG